MFTLIIIIPGKIMNSLKNLVYYPDQQMHQKKHTHTNSMWQTVKFLIVKCLGASLYQ